MGASGLTEDEVLVMLVEAIEEAGGVRAFARKHNVSPTFVSRVWTGKERIGVSLTRPLGLVPMRVYVADPAAKKGRAS